MLYGPQGAFGPAGPTVSQRAAQERHKAAQARIAEAARRSQAGCATPAGSPNVAIPSAHPPQAVSAAQFFSLAWTMLSPGSAPPAAGLKQAPSVQHIQQVVCDHYQITFADLLSVNRAQEFATPRQVAMYLCRTLTGRSLPDIGRRFGDRKHTTVLHAARAVAARLQTSPRLVRHVESILAQLAGPRSPSA